MELVLQEAGMNECGFGRERRMNSGGESLGLIEEIEKSEERRARSERECG